jgi:hypothetical protein
VVVDKGDGEIEGMMGEIRGDCCWRFYTRREAIWMVCLKAEWNSLVGGWPDMVLMARF